VHGIIVVCLFAGAGAEGNTFSATRIYVCALPTVQQLLARAEQLRTLSHVTSSNSASGFREMGFDGVRCAR
jgi:hypothetical protein